MKKETKALEPEVPAGKAIKAAREVQYLLGLMDDLAAIRPFLEDALGPARMVRSLEARRDELQRFTDEQAAALETREAACKQREAEVATQAAAALADATASAAKMITEAEAKRDAALSVAADAETRQRRAEERAAATLDAARIRLDAVNAEIAKKSADGLAA